MAYTKELIKKLKDPIEKRKSKLLKELNLKGMELKTSVLKKQALCFEYQANSMKLLSEKIDDPLIIKKIKKEKMYVKKIDMLKKEIDKIIKEANKIIKGEDN